MDGGPSVSIGCKIPLRIEQPDWPAAVPRSATLIEDDRVTNV
jgi:hypothetical protein